MPAMPERGGSFASAVGVEVSAAGVEAVGVTECFVSVSAALLHADNSITLSAVDKKISLKRRKYPLLRHRFICISADLFQMAIVIYVFLCFSSESMKKREIQVLRFDDRDG